jgi:spermidine/putrescine transport system ATP-binding protein
MQVETKKLQERLGITFVFVTHDQEEALTMSNVIGVINKGRVEQMGNSREIYERPATRFVASFIGEANIIRGRVDSIDDGQAVVRHEKLAILAPAEGVSVGEEVFLSVRPEKVRIGEAAAGCANRFEGTIVDEVYVGLASKLVVGLDLGGRLIANVQIADIGRSIPIGTRVQIGWDPQNAVVIRQPLEPASKARKVTAPP